MAVKYMIFSAELWQLCFNSLRNGYSGIFKVGDDESEVTISKLKMAVYLKIMYLEKKYRKSIC